MKNNFLAPKLLQLSLILSSAFCSHASVYGAENSGNTGIQHTLPDGSSAASPQQLQNGTVEPKKGSKDLRTISGELLAQVQSAAALESGTDLQKTVLINFNNISIIEYIRFISRIINKNFIFDENELQFNVTIISEEPATLENIMTALLQELRIHDLTLLEQGNNLIIHKNLKVNAISQIVSEESPLPNPNSEIITQVFRLNTAVPEQVASVIKPLTSEYALVEILPRTNHLIITDLSTNITQIAKLIKSLDSPASGLVIGQYVVRTTSPEVLIDMARQIITPISLDQPLTMVPWEGSTSIFIVSTPYIVERTLLLLQHIDQNERSTKILDFIDVRQRMPTYQPSIQEPREPREPREIPEEGGFRLDRTPLTPGETEPASPRPPVTFPTNQDLRQRSLQEERNKIEAEVRSSFPGKWYRDTTGNWVLPLGTGAAQGIEEIPTEPLKGTKTKIPSGNWKLDKEGNWYFEPGTKTETLIPGIPQPGPAGHWVIDPVAGWKYVLDKDETKEVRKFIRREQQSAEIPLGAKRKTYFSLYKLQYRRGDSIRFALQAIATSLNLSEPGHHEGMLATLTSVQWLETSNSLIFTGFQEDLLKMRELMGEVDAPLRQVFIEMLILETSMDDSLNYGVSFGSRFANGNWAGGVSVSPEVNPLRNALGQTGLVPGGINAGSANGLLTGGGLNLGVIGQKIVNTATGIEFNSIGALVRASQTKVNTNIILSPKIITEDNVPAEIFVGENRPFKTQSLATDNSNVITNNFEYRDIGTRLRVTPSIGNNDIISIEIAQEISRIIPTTVPLTQNDPGPSTSKSTTTTRVHLPDGYFLIISGMMNDQFDRFTTQVPCLGGIPIIGAAFKDKTYNDTKRNQMIFLRPKIVDTEEEIHNLTKHQQDIWDFKKRRKLDWINAVEDAYDFLNLRNELEDGDPEIAGRDN
ncbi:MAG: type III secretion protein [Parachlamydiaceae bacterium]|nr:type III secretion protein [Parachlamydiaceae bacterium]